MTKTILGLALVFNLTLTSFAANLAVLQSLLERPILEPDTPLAEVQTFTESRVPFMPSISSAADWERYANETRQAVLDQVIFRGAAARWRQTKTRVEWLATIEGGPGYHIKKLRYEVVPGFWIPALLYEPDNLSGSVPAVLNVNGHDPVGKSVPYKQIRCINQVRRGMLALNPEWIGMGQLRGDGYAHALMNQLNLCGTSGIAVFYLAMARALDVLLDHPRTDPERVAVAGLSGGGWQTIFISSLDPRVKLCNPVAGYSSFRTRARFLEDLGDSEQTPCDLATLADYTHLTAMLAPRPALLTFNAEDNCCFASDHALEPLLKAASPIYKLFGQEANLRWHVNHEPGTHNFEQNNREALYRMLGDNFYAGKDFSSREIPCATEIKTNGVLDVALPADNATFKSLALELSKDLPLSAELPSEMATAHARQTSQRAKLREVVRAKHSQVIAERIGMEQKDGLHTEFWRLKVDDAWTVPAIELGQGLSTQTAVLVADQGRRSASAQAQQLLANGYRVLAVDPFYFGESRIPRRDYLFALLVAAVGERPLGIQASQVAAIARWGREKFNQGPVRLVAVGPRSTTYSLVAAGLETEAIGAIELHDALGSLKEVIERNWGANQTPELLCFGLLESFDIKQLASLAAPRRLIYRETSQRVRRELQPLSAWYAAMGGQLGF